MEQNWKPIDSNRINNPPTPSGVERVRPATITNYESPMTIAKSLTFINQTTNQRNNQPFHQSSCRPTNELSNHHPTSNRQSPNSINTREQKPSPNKTQPIKQSSFRPSIQPTVQLTTQPAPCQPASTPQPSQSSPISRLPSVRTSELLAISHFLPSTCQWIH